MRDRLVELVRQGIDIPCVTDNPWDEEACKECRWKGDADCHASKIADHLLDNGVIVPPCKVGDKVYYISDNPINLSVQANTIYEADVVRIVTTHLGTSLVIQIRNEYGCTEIPDVNDWGKTVFRTREEAETKLKGGD